MKNILTKSGHRILSLIVVVAIIFSGVPITAAAEVGCTHEHDDTCGYIEAADCTHEHDADCGGLTLGESGGEGEGDGEAATPGVTDGGLILDGGDGESCVCAAFCDDPDCPVCKDDHTGCAFYYCVCEALCGEDSINPDCPVCKDDYTKCVQAVEVPEIAALATEWTNGQQVSGTISGDITVTGEVTVTGILTISGNVTITGGGTIKRGATGNLITVPSGASLTLNGVTIDGGSQDGITNAAGSLVYIDDGGSLTMKSGTFLQNNTRTSGYGGGVYISNGTFIMDGGEISGNMVGSSGGGVYVSGSSTFTMNGGTISQNTATNLGGGVYNGAVFTMNGGTISGNTSSGNGGGVIVAGSGTFNISGSPKIENNIKGSGNPQDTGGVYLGAGIITIGSAHLSGNAHIGIENMTTTASGATVATGAAASDLQYFYISNADGVIGPNNGFVLNGTNIVLSTDVNKYYVKSNGDDDTGNGTYANPYATIAKAYSQVPSGGEILVMDNITVSTTTLDVAKTVTLKSNGATRTLTRGATATAHLITVASGVTLILENITIDGGNQGGISGSSLVCVYGTFYMNGGTVLKNNTSDENGGGVSNYGTFYMNGGTISGNTAFFGGGVFNSGSSTFTMNGGTISGNTATSNYGGVYGSGTFNAGTGKITITGNKKGTAADAPLNNVHLANNKTIAVSGALHADTRIGVTLATPPAAGASKAVTSGSGSPQIVNFTSDAEGYEVILDGVIKLRNTAKAEVSNTAKTGMSTTYNGSTYNVSQLFNIDSNAGTQTYTVETGGDGAGSLSGNTLTITKAGTINIGLTTAETDTHAAGAKVTATLTVSKGAAPAAPTGLGKTDATTIGGSDGKITGLTASANYEYKKDGGGYEAVTSNTSGEITGLEAGSYVVRLAATDLYNAGADSSPVVIGQPAATYTLAWEGDPGDFADLTYGYTTGSSVTYTVKNTGNSQITGISATISGGNFTAGAFSTTTLNPSDTATVTVTSVTGKNAGTFTGTLTVTWTGGSGATGITKSLSQTVNPKDISSAAVSASFATLTYTGSAQTPTPTSVTIDGVTTTEYTLGAYSSNTNAGTASVVINGTGNYTGTKSVNFTIGSKSLTLKADDKTILVGDPEPSYTYTVIGLVGGDTPAVITTPPTLSVAGFSNTSAATFTITISSGATTNTNYTIGTRTNGTLTVTSKNNVNINISFTDGSATYDGTAKTHETASVSGITAGANPTWTYTYAAGTGTLDGNNKPLTAGTYTVTAKYEDDNNIGTKTADFTINKATPSGTWPSSLTATYGQDLSAISLTSHTALGGVAGTFSWTTSSNKVGNVGTQSHNMTFTPTDATNYNSTSQNVNVTVSAKATTLTIDAISAQTYTGSAITPAVTVKDNGTALTAADYTVSYTNNINAGTANVSVTGKGNYAGSSGSATFAISKANYGDKAASVTVRAVKATTNATLTLPTLPAGASYPVSGTASGALIDSHSISFGTLKFSTTSQAAGTQATITIPVTNAANYNPYNVIVTITAQDPTDAVKVADDLDALTFNDIKNQNVTERDITGDLTLISTGSVYNSAITWASSNTSIIGTDGKVTKPTDSDKTVTLTATVTNGAASGTKVFTLTVKKAPASTGGIGGTVTDSNDSPYQNVTVKIMTGGTNGTLISSTTTNASGVYSFTGLPYGVYSLVVDDGTNTVTRLIIINSSSITEDVKMPSGNQNTHVEVNGSDTPSIAVENLEDVFTPDDITAAQTGLVEIKLVVEAVENPADANIVLQNIGGKELGFYLDAQLLKTVSGNNSGSGTADGTYNIQPPAGTKLKIVIDVPPELQNMAPYSIIRVHNGVAATIPATYDSTLHTLTFEADLFSTYALAYTPKNTNPPNPPSSNGGSSSGGGSSGGSGTTSTIVSTYWIELAEAKAMAKTAKEKELDYVRSRRATITGIRKNALLALTGLRYQHDTVADSAVQVRVYVDDPAKAAKDILVSGYVKGDTVDKVKAKFGKWFTNKTAIVSFDQQGDFGMIIQIAAKVDLSGMDTNNLNFYGYDRKTNKYSRINTEYRIDANGYLHFATGLAGDIIVSNGPLAKKTEAQIEADGNKYYYLAATPTLESLNIDGGDSMFSVAEPPQDVPQNPSAGGDSLSYITTADTPLKLEKVDTQSAGGVLTIDLDASVTQDALSDSLKRDKVSVYVVLGITSVLLLAAMMLWAAIPRKDDPLVSVEDYRKKH